MYRKVLNTFEISMPEILVIIITYNAEQLLDQCLSSVPSIEGPIKGLVIDNGSTDNTVKIITEKYPHIEIIENKKNLGFGEANNIGFRKAIKENYDYVYLLNQDAWIAPDDILRLAKLAEKNPEFGIISPLQVYRDENKIDESFYKNLPQSLKDALKSDVSLHNLYKVNEEKLIPAAHWLINTGIIKQIGGFSPSFFYRGEDNNYSHRLNYFRYKVGVAPALKGIHDREERYNDKGIKTPIKIKWIWTLSNPNWSFKESGYRIYHSMKKELLRKGVGILPAILSFLIKYPLFLLRKYQSKKKGCFL